MFKSNPRESWGLCFHRGGIYPGMCHTSAEIQRWESLQFRGFVLLLTTGYSKTHLSQSFSPFLCTGDAHFYTKSKEYLLISFWDKLMYIERILLLRPSPTIYPRKAVLVCCSLEDQSSHWKWNQKRICDPKTSFTYKHKLACHALRTTPLKHAEFHAY